MNILPTFEIEVTKKPGYGYKLFCYDSRNCNRVNRFLKQYPEDTDFVKEKSEGIFYVPVSEYKRILAVLKS
jgi:hypothetical protein